MYTLKGFINIPSYRSNAHGVVAPFGELSGRSKTYSPDQEVYRSSSDTNTELVVFTTKTDEEDYVAVYTGLTDELLAITQWIYDQSNSGTISTNSTTLAAEISAEFSNATNVEVDVIENIDGTTMPASITVSITGYTEETYIKLWFSDASFLAQYDEWEIRHTSPIDNLDDLFTLTATELNVLLEEQTKSSLVDDLNSITTDAPATRFRAEPFTWIDPQDDTNVEVTWGIAIYGQAGNNIDNIRRSLIDYVLENSTHTREEWIEVLPDMFRSNEFIITPRWDQYAIPTESQVAGVYSPMIKIKDIISKYIGFYPDYDATHVTDNAYTTITPYNNLPVFIVGGAENKDSEFDFATKFPTLIMVDTSSNDMFRMSEDTQSFLRKLMEIIEVAESATTFSQLPTDTEAVVNRIIRSDIMYISTSHDGVEYMVTSKMSYLESLEEE